MFDLIVFDMDGVLVDSEPICNRIWHKHFSSIGVPWTLEEQTRDTLGLSTATMRKMILDRYGIAIPDEMILRQRAELDQAYHTELKAIRDVEAAIKAVAKPRCVASSSSPSRIELSLRLTGLKPYFDPHLFSAAMVERGKPHPDLFLHAARTMGHDPRRAAVIEDSVPGVTAGVAAGMKVFAYAAADYSDAKALAKAGGEVFTDMRDLPKLLGA